MKKTTLMIHSQKEKSRVPKYLFGHFLEYMYDCIDPGLWAEMLLSRGFENMDKNQSGISFPWSVVGADIECMLDNKQFYSPGQSQKVINLNYRPGGIQQENIKLINKQSYLGYVWTFCEKPVSFSIRILSSMNAVIFEQQYEIETGQWYKYEYEFTSEIDDNNAAIQYLITEEGSVWFDQASLMPLDACNGVWNDVMDLIKFLKPSILRFPGGCAADCYFWEDGIGPRDQRPSRENEHWGGVEQNQFGTDEYISLCREIGSEPLICINFGSSTPEDAANWVEYCNGGIDTKYGELRKKNGHPDTYDVKYWEIGNEVFGTWEIGHCDAKSYIEKYKLFANAMKEKDPGIILLACGGDGGNLNQDWNKIVLTEGKESFDSLTLHFYAPLIDSTSINDKELYEAVVAAPVKQEKVLMLTKKTMEKAGYKVPIAVTEWNCNYGEKDRTNREQTIEALVANAGLLNVFLRHADCLNMCNVSDLVNGWPGGIIRSNRGEAFGTATYYLIKMYAETSPEVILDCDYESDTYDIQALGNIGILKKIPYIDIACCLNSNKEIIVYAVNRHYSESGVLEIFDGRITEIQRIWNENILAKNSFEKPDLISIDKMECNCISVELLPHSSYTLKVDLKKQEKNYALTFPDPML